MSKADELRALADRCEREEPSKSLNAAIREALREAMGIWPSGSPKPYTHSLALAMTLVPEEWTAWEICSRGAKTRFSAELSRLDASQQEMYAKGRASAPALALCAAALRARAALADATPAAPPKGGE